MNLQEAIKLLKDNDYEVKPMNEGIGDQVKRTFGNDTLLNQKIEKDQMVNDQVKYFLAMHSGYLTKPAQKLLNKSEKACELLISLFKKFDSRIEDGAKKAKNASDMEQNQFVDSCWSLYKSLLNKFETMVEPEIEYEKVWNAQLDKSALVNIIKKYVKNV